MDNISAGFNEFWETLTGVLSDHRSTIIRLSCFALLIFGGMFAVLGYFNAERIANTDEPLEDTPLDFSFPAPSDEGLNRIAELAQAVNTMRQGSEVLAGSLGGMNRNLFTIDGYDEFGLEDLSGTGASPIAESKEAPPAVEVKAVIISKQQRIAVMNAGGEIGIIARRGTELPLGAGRVIKITQDGVTVRVNKDEIKYSLNSSSENNVK